MEDWLKEDLELLRVWREQSLLNTNNVLKLKLPRTHKEYVRELKNKCPTMIVMEQYINGHTKIKHKCLVCNKESLSYPGSKLKGHACTFCSHTGGGGIPKKDPGILYLVYFYEIGLYKVGITARTVEQRLAFIGHKYTIILTHNFNTGLEAMNLEKVWLANIKKYKDNTGLLREGNTETFRYTI